MLLFVEPLVVTFVTEAVCPVSIAIVSPLLRLAQQSTHRSATLLLIVTVSALTEFPALVAVARTGVV